MITLRDVGFTYFAATPVGAVEAIRHVDARFDFGSLTAIVGPSGCGKTTLLNIIAGLLSPTRGTVESSFQRDGRQRTAYVFQTPRLVPWLSVLENALFAAKLAGDVDMDLERVCRERLDAYGLRDFEHARPHTLSGGMQQRVSLLRALLSGSRVLLLDEPFANFDFILRRQLQEEISVAVKSQMLVAVLVTHDLLDAARLADEILVLSPRPAKIVTKLTIHSAREARASGAVMATREMAAIVTQLEHALSTATEEVQRL